MFDAIFTRTLLATTIIGFGISHGLPSPYHHKSLEWVGPLGEPEIVFSSPHKNFKEIIGIKLQRIPLHDELGFELEKHKHETLEHEREQEPELEHELLIKERERKHKILEHERRELENRELEFLEEDEVRNPSFLDHFSPHNILERNYGHDFAPSFEHDFEPQHGIFGHESFHKGVKHKHFEHDLLEHELPLWEETGFDFGEQFHRKKHEFGREDLFPITQGSRRNFNRREGTNIGNSRRSDSNFNFNSNSDKRVRFNNNNNSNRRGNSNGKQNLNNNNSRVPNINTQELFQNRDGQNNNDDDNNYRNNNNNNLKSNLNNSNKSIRNKQNNNINDNKSRRNSNIEELEALEKEIFVNPEASVESLSRPERHADSYDYRTIDDTFEKSSNTQRGSGSTYTQEAGREVKHSRPSNNGDRSRNSQGQSNEPNDRFFGSLGSLLIKPNEPSSLINNNNNNNENEYSVNADSSYFEKGSNKRPENFGSFSGSTFKGNTGKVKDDEYLILDGPGSSRPSTTRPSNHNNNQNSRPGQFGSGSSSSRPGNHAENIRPQSPSSSFFENGGNSGFHRPSNSNINGGSNTRPHRPPISHTNNFENSRPQRPSSSNFNNHGSSSFSNEENFGTGFYNEENVQSGRPFGSHFNNQETSDHTSHFNEFHGGSNSQIYRPSNSSFSGGAFGNHRPQESPDSNFHRGSGYKPQRPSGSNSHTQSSRPHRPNNSNSHNHENSRPPRPSLSSQEESNFSGLHHNGGRPSRPGYSTSGSFRPNSGERPVGYSGQENKPHGSGSNNGGYFKRNRPGNGNNGESFVNFEEIPERPNDDDFIDHFTDHSDENDETYDGDSDDYETRFKREENTRTSLNEENFFSPHHNSHPTDSSPGRPGRGRQPKPKPKEDSQPRPSNGNSSNKLDEVSRLEGSWLWPDEFAGSRPSKPVVDHKNSGKKKRPAKPNELSTISTFRHENLKLLPVDHCGIDLGNKIVGGTNTQLDEFPWMALLQHTSSDGSSLGYGCGGSLISSRYVLTAAHCIKGSAIRNNVKVTKVRLGEYDTRTEIDCLGEQCSTPPLDVDVESIVVHPDYRPTDRTQKNDIALIRLKEPVPNTAYISPICLPLNGSPRTINGERFTVSGWGKTANGQNGKSSATKQKVSLPGVDLDDCSPFYNKINIQLHNTQMCAGGEKGKDSCQGDSGGPLMKNQVVDGQIKWQVHGIVSYGPQDCGVERVAGIYTRVSEYLDWILDNMKA